jgi:hypothetical protein
MKTSTLAARIERDILADKPVKYVAAKCFGCGHGHVPKPLGEQYYASIIATSDRKRARVAGKGELIRPRRLCERCSKPLPVWLKGKRVPTSRKYCAACQGMGRK